MSTKTFEIGIVMSGAAMAGSYTAGVVDFLVEALDEWEKARIARPGEVPAHRVRLRVMAGASAGSLVTSTAAWMMLRGQPPTRERPAPGRANALYEAWVDRCGLESFLGTDDLPHDDSRLPSVLDGTGIDRLTDAVLERDLVARTKLDLTDGLRARPWIHPELELALTTSSLRGIPYAASYEGGAFHMRTCADHMRFVLGENAPDGAIALALDDPRSPAWQQLVRATLASCAVPMALPSRYVETPRSFYDRRIEVRDPHGKAEGYVPPHWPDDMGDPYASLYIDGGLFDNAPLELAHHALAGGRGLHIERHPLLASRALLLIDPCPGFAAGPYPLHAPREPDFLRDLLAFGLAVVYQPRFQPEDVALARSDRVASRFILVPRRSDEPGARGPLASGPIGAFAGSLHASFREHDFFLGRRNCQQFLRQWFALDPANPIFDDVPSHDGYDVSWTSPEGGSVPKRLIVPLVGTAREEVPLPRWPTIDGTKLMRDLEGPFRARIARAIRALASGRSFFGSRLVGSRVTSELIAGRVAPRLLDSMITELRTAGLAS